MNRNNQRTTDLHSTFHSKMAFITGASSGLGAEFAEQFAAKGYNLLLTARRQQRLEQIKESITSNYEVRVEVITADISKLSHIEHLANLIEQAPDLEILVNCAGFGTVGRFYQVDPEKELAMMNVHMVAPVMFSRAVLPQMLTRNRGAIINVSSLAGLIPIRNVLYHSSKSFLVSFSRALNLELQNSQVTVQALCPGFVYTEFHDTPEYSRFSRKNVPKFLWMTTKEVVTASIKSLDRRKTICIPGSLYGFAGVLAQNSITAGMIRMVAQLILRKRKTFINT